MSPDLATLPSRVGTELGVTDWERFDQAQVDAYAALTGEDLWIHTDPARAAGSPHGGTIVQSSLLMARFAAWIRETGPWLPEPACPLNYGYDRVRIPAALRTGAAVRGRVVLTAFTRRAPGQMQAHIAIKAERDDATTVIAADWIIVFALGLGS